MKLLTFRNLLCSTKFQHSGLLTSLKFSSTSAELREKERDLLEKYAGGSVDLIKDESTGIATVTLNNPTTKNSLTGSMMLELEETVDDLEGWEGGCGVILKGKGNSFCSGMDLSMVKQMHQSGLKEQPRLLSSFMQRVLTSFHCMPLLSVALVEGVALGGGAELSTTCDMRVMSREATIGFVQVRMGLSPAFGSSFRLVNTLGRQQALKLLTSAQVMNATQALERGLVDEILTGYTDSLLETKQYLERYTRGAPEVVRAAKEVVTNNIDMNMLQISNSREQDIFVTLFGEKANLEAVKRKTKF